MVVFVARCPRTVVSYAQEAGFCRSRLKLLERVNGTWRMHFA